MSSPYDSSHLETSETGCVERRLMALQGGWFGGMSVVWCPDVGLGLSSRSQLCCGFVWAGHWQSPGMEESPAVVTSQCCPVLRRQCKCLLWAPWGAVLATALLSKTSPLRLSLPFCFRGFPQARWSEPMPALGLCVRKPENSFEKGCSCSSKPQFSC